LTFVAHIDNLPQIKLLAIIKSCFTNSNIKITVLYVKHIFILKYILIAKKDFIDTNSHPFLSLKKIFMEKD